MTTQPVPTPIRNLDQLVDTYLDLADRITQLVEQQDTIKAQLRDLGIGEHTTSRGITVKVAAPSRRFNLDRAWQMLTPEQRELCTGPDAAKVKRQLPAVLLDDCMDPGTGNPTIKVG